MIVLGADTHKRSHTIAAVAARTGELLGEQTIVVGPRGFAAALQWARVWTQSGCGRLRTAGMCPALLSAFSSSVASGCCGSRRT